MKINVNSDALSKALRIALKAIPSKTAVPIMDSFLITASGSRLVVTATNGEITVKVPVKLNEEAKEKGAVTVPARRLIEFVSLLPGCEVSITTSKTTMDIKWSKGSTKMQLTNVEDYPTLVEPNEGAMMNIPAQGLLTALSLTLPAVSKDNTRPIMTGVHFDILKDITRVVSSDTKMLTYNTLPCSTGKEGQFTIPAVSANLVKAAITKDSTIVRVTFDEKNASFNLGDVIIQTRLISGAYPKYMTVIPQKNAINGEILTSRTSLIGAIRRLGSCSGRLKMKLTPLALTFSAQNSETGTSAVEDCECNYNGSEMEIGINPSNMLSILENISGETICLKVIDPRRPILAQDADDQMDASLSLCMPVSIA